MASTQINVDAVDSLCYRLRPNQLTGIGKNSKISLPYCAEIPLHQKIQ